MDFVNFVMALSPILVVLVGILGFKQSAKRVSPIALVWTLILAFTYFNVTGASFADNVKTLDPLVWKGIKEGLKIVLMVFGAFTILNLLRETGAIDDVKSTIARISDDRRVQLIVIGMMLPIFLEGAAGALTDAELDYLPWGAKIITLECGMRFLTDYLQGDVYFKTQYPHHNLVRCRTQFKLVADMEKKWDEMARIVSDKEKKIL